jgi:hypothetical protein
MVFVKMGDFLARPNEHLDGASNARLPGGPSDGPGSSLAKVSRSVTKCLLARVVFELCRNLMC